MITILVTGGHGFLGKHLVKALFEKDYAAVVTPTSGHFNLTRRQDVDRMFQVVRPDVVIHLAARCGGIGANQKEPGTFLYENAVMGLNMIDAAQAYGVKKFVQLGTVCSYPKYTPVPFREYDLWKGYPEETNAPYGLAKKLLLTQLQAYRQQFGFNGIYLLPANLYGPGDNFDPESSHVIPALIKKIYEATVSGQKKVELWGNGEATREFLYVEDCARGIVDAMEKYDGSAPVNIGNGREVKIYDLASAIADILGFDGEFIFDTSKPNGQPRRCLDTSRAEWLFGFKAKTEITEGLKKTIEWYINSLVV